MEPVSCLVMATGTSNSIHPLGVSPNHPCTMPPANKRQVLAGPAVQNEKGAGGRLAERRRVHPGEVH